VGTAPRYIVREDERAFSADGVKGASIIGLIERREKIAK
jgi:hypothetical protein